MAELISRLKCSSEEFEWHHINARFNVGKARHSIAMCVTFFLIRILCLLQIAKLRYIFVARLVLGEVPKLGKVVEYVGRGQNQLFQQEQHQQTNSTPFCVPPGEILIKRHALPN